MTWARVEWPEAISHKDASWLWGGVGGWAAKPTRCWSLMLYEWRPSCRWIFLSWVHLSSASYHPVAIFWQIVARKYVLCYFIYLLSSQSLNDFLFLFGQCQGKCMGWHPSCQSWESPDDIWGRARASHWLKTRKLFPSGEQGRDRETDCRGPGLKWFISVITCFYLWASWDFTCSNQFDFYIFACESSTNP